MAKGAGGADLNEPGVIAITGLAGFLGGSLALRLLERRPGLRIIGFDRRRPPGLDDRIRFYPIDLGATGADARIADRLRGEGVEALVHAAFRTDATANLDLDREFEVDGSRSVIAACVSAGVAKLVVASSTMLYGPRPDNPNFLSEEHPLRGHPDAHLVMNRIEVESLVAEHVRRATAPETTVLRSCWVLGRRFEDRVTRFFSLPVVPKLIGYDPLIQFLHEDDQLDAFECALLESHPGTFNLVGRGVLPVSHVIRLADKRPLALPARLLYRMAYYPSQRHTGDPPAAFYDYLRHLWVADGARGWAAFGEPVYTTREAWIDFASAARPRRAG